MLRGERTSQGGSVERFGKKMLIVIFVAQLLLLNLILFYFGGIRKYGTPWQFHAKQAAVVKAVTDSLLRIEAEQIPPGNAGDSLMYGLGRHIRLFGKPGEYERRIKNLQTVLDSLKKEKEALDKIELTISRKDSLLRMVQEQSSNQNLGNLAKMFDAMKVQQAVPVIIDLNDTLAVNILTRMQNRNSAKLLGAIAQADTNKAVRLSKLLARMGTVGNQ
jgi:flagellar motility protein MotE (MotC chaperone)